MEKVKNHHWILHIQISTYTKFQLKLTILIFLTKFTKFKSVSRSKLKIRISASVYGHF